MKIIVVGGGQVGSYLASLLMQRGHEVKILEIKERRVENLRKSLPENTVLLGSGTDPKTLETVGVRHTDVVAAVTGSDETNLVISTLSKLEYGVRRVVARVNNPKNAWLFTPLMGVDAALNQADVMAHLVAEEMSMGDMMTLLKLHGGKYSLIERMVGTSSPAAGKRVRDIELPRDCVLVAILRNSDLLIPRGDTLIQAADKLIAITNVDRLDKLDTMLGAGH